MIQHVSFIIRLILVINLIRKMAGGWHILAPIRTCLDTSCLLNWSSLFFCYTRHKVKKLTRFWSINFFLMSISWPLYGVRMAIEGLGMPQSTWKSTRVCGISRLSVGSGSNVLNEWIVFSMYFSFDSNSQSVEHSE